MQNVLLGIDKVTTWMGQAFSWLILGLTAMMTWEILSRRFLDRPHAWTFDAQIQMYGILFMTAGAYTLAKSGHVRGDVLYGFFRRACRRRSTSSCTSSSSSPGSSRSSGRAGSTRASPGSSASAARSCSRGRPSTRSRRSSPSPARSWRSRGSPRSSAACICLRTGEWPSRKEDVVEVDVDKLKELVHVKDEDLAKLDELVVEQQAKQQGEGERRVKIRKELIFGFTLMALIILATAIALPAPWKWASGHYGLFMLCMVVVTIMLGFPTAFTLMGMGVIFTFIAYRSQAGSAVALQQTLDLMVQRTYAVMTNDVLISVPLFVFMGYLVERAALIERLFKALHLAIGRLPGSLAVATLVTCAVFATATGIVGAVVTLMGLLAYPAMLRAKYDVKLSAGVITAGGCLGIIIPPSVLLILYGATASVSVVQLYAGAFFPGIMLAGLYVAYVIIRAIINPSLAPKPPPEETRVDAAGVGARSSRAARGRSRCPRIAGALVSGRSAVPRRTLAAQLALALLPAAVRRARRSRPSTPP